MRSEKREMRTLTPHSSLLTPRFSLLTPLSSLLSPRFSLLSPHSSLLTPRFSLLTPHFSLLTPRFSLLTPRFSLLASIRLEKRKFYLITKRSNKNLHVKAWGALMHRCKRLFHILSPVLLIPWYDTHNKLCLSRKGGQPWCSHTIFFHRQ